MGVLAKRGTMAMIAHVRLYGAALAGMAHLVANMLTAWNSPMIPKLLSGADGYMKITEGEAALVVSLVKFGSVMGAISSVLIVDIVGRKTVLMLTVISTSLSWLMTFWATTVGVLYASRILGGVTCGVILTTCPMYIAEISPPALRGRVGCCFFMSGSFGNLVSYVTGTVLSVREYSCVAVLIALLQVIVFSWFPETPYHLVRRKRREAALSSLRFLHGSENVDEAMESIIRSVEANPSDLGPISSIRHLLSSARGRRIFFLGMGLMVAQSSAGGPVLINYAQSIFGKINNLPLDAKYYSYILATTGLFSQVLSIVIVDRFGRKPLMISSAIGMTVITFVVGIYFFLQSSNPSVVSRFGWLAAIGVLLCSLTLIVGIGTLPLVVTGEIFPMHAKAVCMGFSISWFYVCSFAMLEMWGVLTMKVNVYSAFWVLSLLNVFNAIFVIFCVPETKRETLHQIQVNFNNK